MSDYNPCCFCLGGEADIPPFGKLKDAQDFVNPCSTCTLTSHRKCLLDWFSSLPSDKLRVIDALIVPIDEADANNDENDLSSSDFGFNNRGDGGGGGDGDQFELFVSPQQINRWLNGMTSGLGPNTNYDPNSPLECQFVLLVASCPQCKGDITFSMKRSQLLTLNLGLRTLISRTAQVGCVFTVVASAITGVLSMLYIGLTTCGLKIMDSLVPGPLLVKMLQKPSSNGIGLFLDVTKYSVDTLELALSRGMIDPFKFSRIPILPIVLYRMRSTSLLSCLIGIRKTTTINSSSSSDNSGSTPSGSSSFNRQYNIQLNSWLTEFMINGYISSLGNHKLIKQLCNNFLNKTSILLGVDLWNVNNMMSMLIPTRWLYDLFYRLTINRLHFNLAMRVRPRDIANSLSQQEFEKLEQLDSNLSSYECDFHYLKERANNQVDSQYQLKNKSYFTEFTKFFKRKINYAQLCHRAGLPKIYLNTKLSAWILETKACIENDYSGTFIYKSFTLRCLTTILWPFLSSKLGHLIFNTLLKKFSESHNIPSNKLLLLSNMIGLVGVVFIKDLINLYLCSQKASQIGNMIVMGDLTGKKRKPNGYDNQSPETAENDNEPEPYMLNFLVDIQ